MKPAQCTNIMQDKGIASGCTTNAGVVTKITVKNHVFRQFIRIAGTTTGSYHMKLAQCTKTHQGASTATGCTTIAGVVVEI